MDPPWNQETPEHINYTKLCRLLYDGGTLALKTVFDTKCPPASLATTLATNQTTLQMLKGKVLHQDQWDLLYPPSGASPKSEDFDITLLSFLLKNICSLSAPVKFKTQKIRKCRNKITAHRPKATVNDCDFEFYWNEISSALVSLGLNQDDIDKLKSSSLGEKNYNKLMENWESCDREIEQQLELMNTKLAVMDEKLNDIHSTLKTQQFEMCNLANIDYTGLIQRNCKMHHPFTRQWIFNQVEENMKEVTTGASVVVIRAGPGMGKSIVSAKLCQIYQNKGLLGGCHFFQHNDSLRNNPRIMLQSIANQLCKSVPGYQPALETKLKTLQGKTLSNMNCQELFGVLFEEPLSQIKIDHDVVIVIDALDECASQFKKELEDSLRNKLSILPPWIRFVITARPLPSFDNLSSTVEIGIKQSDPRNIQDINTFLAFELAKRSADQSTLIDKLMEISQGLFLVAYFILEILDQSEDQSLPHVIKHLPRGITSVYEYYFSRIKDLIKPYLSSSQSEDSFYKMLDAVVASESPIPKEMFYEILCLKSVDEVEREKRKERNDAVHLLHTIFPVENDHVTAFHKTVTDWLKDDARKNPEFSVSVSRGVEVLAEKSFNDLKTFNERQIPLDQLLELSDCEMFLFKYGIGYIMDSSQFSDSQKEEIKNDVRVLAVSFNIYEHSLSDPSWLYQLGVFFFSMCDFAEYILLVSFPAKKSFGCLLSTVGTALLNHKYSPLSSAEKRKVCQFLDQNKLPYYLLSTDECFDLPPDFHHRFPSPDVFEVTNGFIVCAAKNDDNECLDHSIVCCLVKEGGIVRAEPFMKTFDKSHVVRGVSPDKKNLIVTTTRKIEFYDVPTLEKVDLEYDCPVDPMDSLHIFGDAEQWYIVVTAERDSNIYILNGINGQLINTINVDKPFSERKQIVTVSQYGDIVIVNVLHDSDYSNEDDDDDYSHDYDWAIVINDSLYKVEIYSVHFMEKDTKNAIIYKTGSPIKKEIGYCSFLNTETPLNDTLETYLDFKFSDDGKYLAFNFMNYVYLFCTRNESECKTIDLDVRPFIEKNIIISVSQSQLITSNVYALLLFSLDDGQEKAMFRIEYDIYSFNSTDNFNSMPSCWVYTFDKLIKMNFHNL